ncbi:MAG TPA: hypothetical protein K8W13_02260 [Enterococcus columbae]|nr:hypothetical protein [Enterococcus columbae]
MKKSVLNGMMTILLVTSLGLAGCQQNKKTEAKSSSTSEVVKKKAKAQTKEKSKKKTKTSTSATSESKTASSASASDQAISNTEKSPTPAAKTIFASIEGKQFIFSSGAGAWSTGLKIMADGRFTGQYSDMDMGDVGTDNPNGTQYLSTFAGSFEQVQQLNANVYVLKIKDLTYANPVDSQEIVDGIKRIYTNAHGLAGANQLYLYLPTTPLSEIPEEYKNWIAAGMVPNGATTLGFYGIYNEAMQTGFVSY